MTDEFGNAAATSVNTPTGTSHFHNAREHLMPSTFEERGAAVPFTSPALELARVRKDWRDRLELIVGNFASSQGVYVVPWGAVREVVTLTAHDIMLHESVLERKALDPHAVRLAAFDVARTGLAGPEVAEAAARALKLDEEAEALHQLLLILQLINEVEPGAMAKLFQDIKTDDGQEKVRATLGSISERLGLSEQMLDERIVALSHETYAIGVKWNPEESRLRALLGRLRGFMQSVREWGAQRTGESAEQAKFTADVAEHSLALATDTFSRYDDSLRQTLDIMKAGEKGLTDATRLAHRISWLLDGWEALIESWGRRTSDQEAIELLAHILPLLPLVPRDENKGTERRSASAGDGHSSRRWVRATVDWRTGDPDPEMVTRLEGIKAAAR